MAVAGGRDANVHNLSQAVEQRRAKRQLSLLQRADADLKHARLFLLQRIPIGPGLFFGSFAFREIYCHRVFFIITQVVSALKA